MPNWNKESIAELSDKELEQLYKNALRLQKREVAELCAEEIERRKPVSKTHTYKQGTEERAGLYVSEFHFVCPGELGVTRNPDGTIWTGTWVVAESNAETAAKYGSIVALHVSKAEPSYIQGIIKDWRKGPREDRYSGEQTTNTKEGILFLLEPTPLAIPWSGDGTGEKGYAWAPLPR